MHQNGAINLTLADKLTSHQLYRGLDGMGQQIHSCHVLTENLLIQHI